MDLPLLLIAGRSGRKRRDFPIGRDGLPDALDRPSPRSVIDRTGKELLKLLSLDRLASCREGLRQRTPGIFRTSPIDPADSKPGAPSATTGALAEPTARIAMGSMPGFPMP
jgi:hypothetical protein